MKEVKEQAHDIAFRIIIYVASFLAVTGIIIGSVHLFGLPIVIILVVAAANCIKDLYWLWRKKHE